MTASSDAGRVLVKHYVVAFRGFRGDESPEILIAAPPLGGALGYGLPSVYLIDRESGSSCIGRIGEALAAELTGVLFAGMVNSPNAIEGHTHRFANLATVEGTPDGTEWWPLRSLPRGMRLSDFSVILTALARKLNYHWSPYRDDFALRGPEEGCRIVRDFLDEYERSD